MMLIALLVPICICLNYMVVFPETNNGLRTLKEPVKRDK